MFDLAALVPKDTFELHLRHPVSEELLYADEAGKKPVQIVLFGTSSKAYRKALTDMQNRNLKRSDKQRTAEIMREEGIKLLVACSQSAKNLSFNGVAIASADDFYHLYSDDKFEWLKSQVDKALGDVSNFIQA